MWLSRWLGFQYEKIEALIGIWDFLSCNHSTFSPMLKGGIVLGLVVDIWKGKVMYSIYNLSIYDASSNDFVEISILVARVIVLLIST